MQFKMGHWDLAPYSVKAHFYPPGHWTWHPRDSWNSLGISALQLGFWQPTVKLSMQPGQTRFWSEVSVIPRDWPVPQGCLHRNWGRMRIKRELVSGNIYWDRKFVKNGRKNIFLGGMLCSLGSLEFEIECSQVDLISPFCPGTYFIESITNWPLQGSHRSCPDCFLLQLILNVSRFWFSEIPRQFLENPQALWTHTSTKAKALSISQKQALKH